MTQKDNEFIKEIKALKKAYHCADFVVENKKLLMRNKYNSSTIHTFPEGVKFRLLSSRECMLMESDEVKRL